GGGLHAASVGRPAGRAWQERVGVRFAAGVGARFDSVAFGCGASPANGAGGAEDGCRAMLMGWGGGTISRAVHGFGGKQDCRSSVRIGERPARRLAATGGGSCRFVALPSCSI